jgi:molybdopterin-biosynthesis enzyme MoeA-like protein
MRDPKVAVSIPWMNYVQDPQGKEAIVTSVVGQSYPPSAKRPLLEGPPAFGIIIVGDEILSGKRKDKHLAKAIELLGARGLQLSWAEYVGDAPDRISDTLTRVFSGGDVVFCCGGIGATPDDHTRQAAARALGEPLHLHLEAAVLLRERMQEVAKEQGTPFDPDRPDNIHRLNMAMFPERAEVIPNPYNKIAGFRCVGGGGAQVHFVPGFPVMAWPMMEWVLDTHYAHLLHQRIYAERSVIVFGAMEAALTPLMERIERDHPGVKVFSLPSVDHPEFGRHIELGVKGVPELAELAYQSLRLALVEHPALTYGPELVR